MQLSLSFLYAAFGFNPFKLLTSQPEGQTIQSLWLQKLYLTSFIQNWPSWQCLGKQKKKKSKWSQQASSHASHFLQIPSSVSEIV